MNSNKDRVVCGIEKFRISLPPDVSLNKKVNVKGLKDYVLLTPPSRDLQVFID